MQFCPRCKNLMLPKRAHGKLILKCGCGYERKTVDPKETKTLSSAPEPARAVEIVDSETNPMPRVEWKCKCGSNEAFHWSAQLRRGDEAETMFFRCVKCGKTYRRSG